MTGDFNFKLLLLRMGNTCCRPKFNEIKGFFSNMYISKIPFTMLMKIVYLRWQNGLDDLNWKYLVDSVLCKDLKTKKEILEYTQFWTMIKYEYKASTLILTILILGYDSDINDKDNFKRYFCQFTRFAYLQSFIKSESDIKSGKEYFLVSLLKEVVKCYVSLISYDCIRIENLVRIDKIQLEDYRTTFTKTRINKYVNNIFAGVKTTKSELEVDQIVELEDFMSLLDSELKDDNVIRENLMKLETPR